VSGVSLLGEQVTACRERLDAFRWEVYRSLTRWPDALFELCDAVLCAPGPVTSLPELSLTGVHRRGHGSTYAALADGRVDVDRLRMALAGLQLPRGSDGQLRLAVDVTPWPRPDAQCSAQRAHAHRPCRCDGVRQTIPGWPYSIVAVLESGRSSWTAPLDAVRLVPGQGATEVTATQIRQVWQRLCTAGQWRDGDPPILVVLDAGYDIIRLAWLLRDLPVRLLGRVRGNRVFHAAAPGYAGIGRPGRHGPAMKLYDPSTWPTPAQTAASAHERYGQVAAWGHYHPKLQRGAGWATHPDRYRSWKALSFTCGWIGCPVTGPRSRCGCGTAIPMPPVWTCCGCSTSSSADLIWNTRFGFSSRHWAGPGPGCVTPTRPTDGRG
jgi:DDE superfamily endonuclease